MLHGRPLFRANRRIHGDSVVSETLNLSGSWSERRRKRSIKVPIIGMDFSWVHWKSHMCLPTTELTTASTIDMGTGHATTE